MSQLIIDIKTKKLVRKIRKSSFKRRVKAGHPSTRNLKERAPGKIRMLPVMNR